MGSRALRSVSLIGHWPGSMIMASSVVKWLATTDHPSSPRSLPNPAAPFTKSYLQQDLHATDQRHDRGDHSEPLQGMDLHHTALELQGAKRMSARFLSIYNRLRKHSAADLFSRGSMSCSTKQPAETEKLVNTAAQDWVKGAFVTLPDLFCDSIQLRPQGDLSMQNI